MHPDIVLTDPMMAEPARGREPALDRAKAHYTPFPDGRMEMIGDPFVSLEEPELAYRWRFLDADLHGIDPLFASTGRRVEIEGTSVLRFTDKQVVDVSCSSVPRTLLAAPSAGSPLEHLAVLAQRPRAWWKRRSHRWQRPRCELPLLSVAWLSEVIETRSLARRTGGTSTVLTPQGPY